MAFFAIPGFGIEPISIGWARVLTERMQPQFVQKVCNAVSLEVDSKAFCPRIWAWREQMQNTECARYVAPAPLRTAGTVFASIFKSSQSDHSSIYCRSRSIH